jgi:hypothetical protein
LGERYASGRVVGGEQLGQRGAQPHEVGLADASAAGQARDDDREQCPASDLEQVTASHETLLLVERWSVKC